MDKNDVMVSTDKSPNEAEFELVPEQASHPSDPLANAPEHIKLAVDLIYLLETNEIPAKMALAALEVVKQDLESKLTE